MSLPRENLSLDNSDSEESIFPKWGIGRDLFIRFDGYTSLRILTADSLPIHL